MVVCLWVVNPVMSLAFAVLWRICLTVWLWLPAALGVNLAMLRLVMLIVVIVLTWYLGLSRFYITT